MTNINPEAISELFNHPCEVLFFLLAIISILWVSFLFGVWNWKSLAKKEGPRIDLSSKLKVSIVFIIALFFISFGISSSCEFSSSLINSITSSITPNSIKKEVSSHLISLSKGDSPEYHVEEVKKHFTSNAFVLYKYSKNDTPIKEPLSAFLEIVRRKRGLKSVKILNDLKKSHSENTKMEIILLE
jgi:hypothetical protein